MGAAALPSKEGVKRTGPYPEAPAVPSGLAVCEPLGVLGWIDAGL